MAPSVAPELIEQARLGNFCVLGPFGTFGIGTLSQCPSSYPWNKAGQVEVIGSHSWAMSYKNKISHTLESSCQCGLRSSQAAVVTT